MESPLSDQDYQEFIALRVKDQIRKEAEVERRWKLSTRVAAVVGAVTIFVGTTAIVVSLYMNDLSLRQGLDQVTVDPRVTGLESGFSNIDRLDIVGVSFGDMFGRVEVYYEPGDEDCRSDTIILDEDEIDVWRNDQISLEPSSDQKEAIFDSLFEHCSEPPFEGQRPEDLRLALNEMVPYISVRTSDGRLSPVW